MAFSGSNLVGDSGGLTVKIQKIVSIKTNPDGTQDWRVQTVDGQMVKLIRVSQRFVEGTDLKNNGTTVSLTFRYDLWDDDRSG